MNPFDSHYLDMLMQAIYAKAHGSPLEPSYWSCVPYLYGEGRAFKYRFVPRDDTRLPVPFPAPDNYLRQNMRKRLDAVEAVEFDFKYSVPRVPDAHAHRGRIDHLVVARDHGRAAVHT